MAATIVQAGLPKRYLTHGIRKTTARRFAGVACSSRQIAVITGHKSLEEVERHVRATEQKRLARAAIRLPTDSENCQPPA
jgi:integrase